MNWVMKSQYIYRGELPKKVAWIVWICNGRLGEKKGADNPVHTMKLRYSFTKVALAQNIVGEVSFKVAKKRVAWLVSNKKSCNFIIGPVLWHKNEGDIMDKPYTSISSKLPCVMCLYFFKTLILTIFMNLCTRDNRVLGIWV